MAAHAPAIDRDQNAVRNICHRLLAAWLDENAAPAAYLQRVELGC